MRSMYSNTNFGVAESNAMWIIDTWLYALGLQAGNPTYEGGSCREVSSDFINRLKDAFDTMIVFKDLQQNNFISSFTGSCISCNTDDCLYSTRHSQKLPGHKHGG